MGFLEVGTPLHWKESIQFMEYIREHGVQQFINLYNKVKDRCGDQLLWGDEVEYILVHFDEDTKSVKLSLRAPEVLEQLENMEKTSCCGGDWKPEYGSFMVEGTPKKPYGNMTLDLQCVEKNMRVRRMHLLEVLKPGEAALSVVNFPLMGVGDFTIPSSAPGGEFSRSSFVSDSVICPHPRFGTLTANIRNRRGSKVDINLPLFKDIKTELPKKSNAYEPWDATNDPDEPSEAPEQPTTSVSAEKKPNEIHMDCMAFGMGACCLQVTFQAKDVAESRTLYDQLAVVAPIMLALTAASPIWKGMLADTDTRWTVISEAVDCRTPKERGLNGLAEWQKHVPLEEIRNGERKIEKSRYDSIDHFIAESPFRKPHHNDIESEIDEDTLRTLKEAGIDDALATHIAHLFIRDPLVLFKERVEVDDDATTEHFESIQSTNWQSVRWKPPPSQVDDKIGWRVELRTMETQITDFENAAFTVFVVLLNRAMIFFGLNLYMPLSKVDENMKRAKLPNAAVDQKFWFRKCMMACCNGPLHSDEPVELYISEILLGRDGRFPGFIPLILAYLDVIEAGTCTRSLVEKYLTFIKNRATGTLPTTATWMRNFVRSHPDYKYDSMVSESIAFDLLKECRDISLGVKQAPELIGEVNKVAPFAPPTRSDLLKRKFGCRENPRRLRGASFNDNINTPDVCRIVQSLMKQYEDSHVLSSSSSSPSPIPESDEGAADLNDSFCSCSSDDENDQN
eukprot:TRINITY_DN916_c0_g2_i1.p1 TRINITY_DN916_c0_g2~~TRINITY_DN916_c0_g2_i1.p1  ORF type:complete len:736 (+),score=258.37 TRINITY_DN916_c0_g2_i1:37-2244(+)